MENIEKRKLTFKYGLKKRKAFFLKEYYVSVGWGVPIKAVQQSRRLKDEESIEAAGSSMVVCDFGLAGISYQSDKIEIFSKRRLVIDNQIFIHS